MAHSRTAKKAVRQNLTRRLRNQAAKSAVRTRVKKLRALFAAGDAKAPAEYRAVARMLDKVAQRGILKKNTTSRLKARLGKHVAAAK